MVEGGPRAHFRFSRNAATRPRRRGLSISKSIAFWPTIRVRLMVSGLCNHAFLGGICWSRIRS